MCHECDAGTNREPLFTDLRARGPQLYTPRSQIARLHIITACLSPRSPTWLPTMHERLPWSLQCSLQFVVGLSKGMIRWDVLHLWHLGVGRDAVASILEFLCAESDFFGAHPALPNRLSAAYANFRSWCLVLKKFPVISTFTKENLHFSTTPTCTFKASDIMLITSWLGDIFCEVDIEIVKLGRCRHLPGTVVQLLQQFAAPADREWVLARRVVCLMRMILATWWHNPLVMRPASQQRCYDAGLLVLRAWGHLSHMSAMAGRRRWHMKPKIHAVAHVIHSMADSERHQALNPAADACFMDEDMIGKIMRIVRQCHPTTVGVKACELYAAHLNLLLFPPAEAFQTLLSSHEFSKTNCSSPT